MKLTPAFAATLCMLAGTGAALAQESEATKVVPRFERLAPIPADPFYRASSNLATWTYDWSYGGSAYSATIVGSQPGAGVGTTTVPVFIIPVKIEIGTKAFTPTKLQANGVSALANTKASPLFKNLTYTEAGTDVGKTQYIDAIQRAGFWSQTSTDTTWHTLFGKPTVLPLQTIVVPASEGGVHTAFGVSAAIVNINWMDPELQAILAAFPEITPDSVPIFMVYDTYLSDNNGLSGCCIGGYHSAIGAQAYSEFSYIGATGAFWPDVSALSHELGELVMDPFVNNNSPCGILEIGDPLRGRCQLRYLSVHARHHDLSPAGPGPDHLLRCAADHVAGKPRDIPGNPAQRLPERQLRLSAGSAAPHDARRLCGAIAGGSGRRKVDDLDLVGTERLAQEAASHPRKARHIVGREPAHPAARPRTLRLRGDLAQQGSCRRRRRIHDCDLRWQYAADRVDQQRKMRAAQHQRVRRVGSAEQRLEIAPRHGDRDPPSVQPSSASATNSEQAAAVTRAWGLSRRSPPGTRRRRSWPRWQSRRCGPNALPRPQPRRPDR